MIEVKYKNEDITDEVSINTCYHDMYAEGQADTLTVIFNDTEHLWDIWQPKTDDEIAVEYGAIKTGKMFIRRMTAANGLFRIIATSIPASALDRKSKAWQKVKFKKIAEEIAKAHDLSFESYGIKDITYSYIQQKNESDFSFLNRLCILEGCAFLVYDGALVLYSYEYMEENSSGETMYLGEDSDYAYTDKSDELYGKCKIEQGSFKGSAKEDNGSNKVLVPKIKVTVNSKEEAGRYAKNILRHANRNARAGYFYSEIETGYAPGSVTNIENERAPSWAGKVFIEHLRNDYGKGFAKVFFRRL